MCLFFSYRLSFLKADFKHCCPEILPPTSRLGGTGIGQTSQWDTPVPESRHESLRVSHGPPPQSSQSPPRITAELLQINSWRSSAPLRARQASRGHPPVASAAGTCFEKIATPNRPVRLKPRWEHDLFFYPTNRNSPTDPTEKSSQSAQPPFVKRLCVAGGRIFGNHRNRLDSSHYAKRARQTGNKLGTIKQRVP